MIYHAQHFRPCFRRYRVILPLTIFGVAIICSTVFSQTVSPTVTRDVISGGGGTTQTTGTVVRGTLSQTAVGRLKTGGAFERHDVGFWYKAYQPEVVTTVSLPIIETNVETRVSVDLTLKTFFPRELTRPFFPRPFTARIRFNGTLLHPIEGTPTCNWDGDDCVLEIRDTARSPEGIIASFSFLTALGNQEGTPLTIEEFTWSRLGEERISVVEEHGALTLLDVCREGDQIRLIESGAAARLSIWPNPASSSATIECTPNESGMADIRLVNLLGAEVAQLAQQQMEADRSYRLSLDLTTIPSGTYTLILRLPATTITRRLIVRE
ncbi:MAG: T9SS type A sorting domain-containing protein [Candidatus Kapaibacterium sp.]|nr:T9SS type A sorting domain-containing protein [Ignavibacteria bacterium]